MTKRRQRKELQSKLNQLVFRVSCSEHYHTSNPPPWEGYVVADSDMVEIRRLISELSAYGL